MRNTKTYQSAFGIVCYRAGAWEGEVIFQRKDDNEGSWSPEETFVGRFKRPRNAMIAVEDKAREIKRRLADEVKVEIED